MDPARHQAPSSRHAPARQGFAFLLASLTAVLGGVAFSGGRSLAAAGGQDPAVGLRDWAVERRGSQAEVDGDVLRVSGGKGWIRADGLFLDFALRFEFRLATDDASGAILLRIGQPSLPGRWPASGYRVAVSRSAAPEELTGAVRAYGAPLRAIKLAAGQPLPVGEWQQAEVRLEGDRLTFTLNGTVVTIVEGSEPLAGRVGIEGTRGSIEYRSVWVTPTGSVGCAALPRPDDGDAAPMTLARARHEVRPLYTLDALERKVMGTVAVEAVVEPDGSVASACVRRGLDPDLDVQALAAAKRWRFWPGTRDGRPAQSTVTIDMEFRLK